MKETGKTGGGPQTAIGLAALSHAPMSGPDGTLGVIEVHQHTEIELIVYEHGSVTMLFGGQTMKIPPRRLLVFWGAMPHHALDADPKAMAYLLRLPMPLVLQWNLPAWLVQQLVDFQVLMDAPNPSPCPDLDLVKHWIRLMASASVEGERIVMLEAEARLRRMALDCHASPVLAPRATGAGRIERMVEVIAQRCLGRLRIPDVAAAAGLTRAYAMRLFHRTMGVTMLEYITRQRVSHAQRLLATTDRGVLDIMQTCGFTSTTRFYTVFRRIAGCKPAEYRLKLQPFFRRREGHEDKRPGRNKLLSTGQAGLPRLRAQRRRGRERPKHGIRHGGGTDPTRAPPPVRGIRVR